MRGWPIEARGWPIEVRGWPIEVRGLELGPVDKSEGLGAGLARALSINVRGWGPGRPRPAGPQIL